MNYFSCFLLLSGIICEFERQIVLAWSKLWNETTLNSWNILLYRLNKLDTHALSKYLTKQALWMIFFSWHIYFLHFRLSSFWPAMRIHMVTLITKILSGLWWMDNNHDLQGCHWSSHATKVLETQCGNLRILCEINCLKWHRITKIKLQCH